MDPVAEELVSAVDGTIGAWVERSVAWIMTAYLGEVPAGVRAAAERAGEDARSEVVPELRRLLERDVDEQWTSPLSIVRAAVRFPTAVLEAAGVPEVQRDEFRERAFPEDRYAPVTRELARSRPGPARAGPRLGRLEGQDGPGPPPPPGLTAGPPGWATVRRRRGERWEAKGR